MAALSARVALPRSMVARRPSSAPRRGVVGVRTAAAAVPVAASTLCSAAQVALVALGANVILMTTVKKTGINPGALVDVLTAKAGVKSTAVELNKALSMTALSLLGLAYLPVFEPQRADLLMIAMVAVWVHSAASFTLGKAAQFPSLLPPNMKEARQLGGLALGGMSIQLLALTNFGILQNPAIACYGVLTLSALHWLAFNWASMKGANFRPFVLASLGLVVAGVVSVASGGSTLV